MSHSGTCVIIAGEPITYVLMNLENVYKERSDVCC
jgi:hypothetical protein